MVIVDTKIGAEGNLDLELTAGKLVLKVSENTPGCVGNADVEIPLTYFLDALAVKMNSTVATVLINGLKAIIAAV